MKKTLYFLLAAFGLCLAAGCSSSDGGNDDPGGEVDSPYYQQIAGDWQLTAWTGEKPDDFDAYVTFGADRSFVVYQKIERPTWDRYTGSFRFDNKTLSGVYANGTPWGASYEIEFDASGKSFRLVSNTAIQEVSTYTRATIPADVKSTAAPRKASRADGFLLF